jgi:hypothetical protein
MIVFNATDRIVCDGRIDKIAINFCRAPTKNDAIIELYSIRESPNDLNHFFVKQFDSIITNLKISKGIQKAAINEISVQEGEYIGFKFGTNAGSPFTTECTSYYTNDVLENSEQEHKILFTQCINHGISVSFSIKNHRDTKKSSKRKITGETNEEQFLMQVEQHVTKAKQKPLRTLDSNINLITENESIFCRCLFLDLTKFQERDNMLRESSIAQEHWQRQLQRIIDQERDEVDREKKAQVMHTQELIEQMNKLNEKLSNRSSN